MTALPRRKLGASGLEFTTVGLGTWNMEARPESAVAAIRRGVEEGANHIDTAELYGYGEVEKLVGRALRGLREKVYVVSKVLPTHARRNDVVAACLRSLKHLGLDYLDVYLLHWRQKTTPLEETFEAFEKLRRDGMIRHWGVSNFGVKDMEEAAGLAGDGKIACNQVLYHLQERAIEFELIPWCRDRGVAVVAYSPFGNNRMPSAPALDKIARARGATPAQVALAFLTRDPNVIAIPKSSDADRAAENVRAGRLALSPAEIKELDASFPARPRRSLPTI